MSNEKHIQQEVISMDDSTKRKMRIMKTHRKELGLCQKDVAEKACITLQQYQNFESGRRRITNCSAIIALRICVALELDPYDLIFESGRDCNK